MSRGIEILLSEILDAIALLRDYTAGLDFDAFAASVEKQDSVLRRLEIIGEAAKGIPDEVRTQYPSHPVARLAVTTISGRPQAPGVQGPRWLA